MKTHSKNDVGQVALFRYDLQSLHSFSISHNFINLGWPILLHLIIFQTILDYSSVVLIVQASPMFQMKLGNLRLEQTSIRS